MIHRYFACPGWYWNAFKHGRIQGSQNEIILSEMFSKETVVINLVVRENQIARVELQKMKGMPLSLLILQSWLAIILLALWGSFGSVLFYNIKPVLIKQCNIAAMPLSRFGDRSPLPHHAPRAALSLSNQYLAPGVLFKSLITCGAYQVRIFAVRPPYKRRSTSAIVFSETSPRQECNIRVW